LTKGLTKDLKASDLLLKRIRDKADYITNQGSPTYLQNAAYFTKRLEEEQKVDQKLKKSKISKIDLYAIPDKRNKRSSRKSGSIKENSQKDNHFNREELEGKRTDRLCLREKLKDSILGAPLNFDLHRSYDKSYRPINAIPSSTKSYGNRQFTKSFLKKTSGTQKDTKDKVSARSKRSSKSKELHYKTQTGTKISYLDKGVSLLRALRLNLKEFNNLVRESSRTSVILHQKAEEKRLSKKRSISKKGKSKGTGSRGSLFTELRNRPASKPLFSKELKNFQKRSITLREKSTPTSTLKKPEATNFKKLVIDANAEFFIKPEARVKTTTGIST